MRTLPWHDPGKCGRASLQARFLFAFAFECSRPIGNFAVYSFLEIGNLSDFSNLENYHSRNCKWRNYQLVDSNELPCFRLEKLLLPIGRLHLNAKANTVFVKYCF